MRLLRARSDRHGGVHDGVRRDARAVRGRHDEVRRLPLDRIRGGVIGFGIVCGGGPAALALDVRAQALAGPLGGSSSSGGARGFSPCHGRTPVVVAVPAALLSLLSSGAGCARVHGSRAAAPGVVVAIGAAGLHVDVGPLHLHPILGVPRFFEGEEDAAYPLLP